MIRSSARAVALSLPQIRPPATLQLDRQDRKPVGFWRFRPRRCVVVVAVGSPVAVIVAVGRRSKGSAGLLLGRSWTMPLRKPRLKHVFGCSRSRAGLATWSAELGRPLRASVYMTTVNWTPASRRLRSLAPLKADGYGPIRIVLISAESLWTAA